MTSLTFIHHWELAGPGIKVRYFTGVLSVEALELLKPCDPESSSALSTAGGGYGDLGLLSGSASSSSSAS